MADFRLIIISIILSVFSIASNSLLLKHKEKLSSKHEKNFAIISLVGSILILLAALYFGFKSRGEAGAAAAGRLRGFANRLNSGY